MAKGKRSKLFPTDEELGKRDDDHKPSSKSQWVPKTVAKPRKRRFLSLLLIVILLIVILKGLSREAPPAEPSYAEKMARTYSSHAEDDDDDDYSFNKGPIKAQGDVPGPPRTGPRGAPQVKGRESMVDQTTHSFDGPVKFYYLAASLHSISKTGGSREKNKNVLFAASSLKSAAAIIPLACEMSRWKRSYVHIAIMGRDELPLDDIKTINGISKETCDIHWHDARPDYAIYSSDHRMEVSIMGAMKHIYNFIHPQAIITSGSRYEDAFFTRAMHRKTKEQGQTLIQVPQDKPEEVSWLARLDASSLKSWHTASIDLLVQAPAETSGSIVRLLKSLASANYDGFEPPRLTIELPSKLNDASAVYLDNFEWPPARFESHQRNSQLVLRRRIPNTRADADHAAIRFIESFYPADDENAHVFVLSPQAQLSPMFFHTLKYYLLEYKYSDSAWIFGKNIFGISLESPSVYLNGSAGFEPPIQPEKESTTTNANGMSLYLWQAPNSNAALYFADKWVELHSFLTQHLNALKHPATKRHHESRPKMISPKYPAWTERFLDLMRARGYYMLYPVLKVDADAHSPEKNSLVIVHNELYTPPEEFSVDAKSKADAKSGEASSLAEDAVLDAPAEFLASHSKGSSGPTGLNIENPLLKNLRAFMPEGPAPDDDEDDGAYDQVAKGQGPRPLPMLYALPLIDYKGVGVTHDALNDEAIETAKAFRRDAGGCSAETDPKDEQANRSHSADDLFCLSDHAETGSAHEDTNSKVTEPQAPARQHEDTKEDGPSKSIPPDDPSQEEPSYDGSPRAQLDADELARELGIPRPPPPQGKSFTSTENLPEIDPGLTPGERKEFADWQRTLASGAGEKPPPDAKGQAQADAIEAGGRVGRLKGWDEGGIDEAAKKQKPKPNRIGNAQAEGLAEGGRMGRLRGWDQGGIDEAASPAERAAAVEAEDIARHSENKGERIAILDPDVAPLHVQEHLLHDQGRPAAAEAEAEAEEEAEVAAAEAALEAQSETPPEDYPPVVGGAGAAAAAAAAAAQRPARAKAGTNKVVVGKPVRNEDREAVSGSDADADADADAEEDASQMDRVMAELAARADEIRRQDATAAEKAHD